MRDADAAVGEVDQDQGGRRSRSGWRPSVRMLLELFCMSGLAIAQPLLDVFGRSPDAFIFHDATTTDIVAFAVVLAVVPALALWGVVQLVGIAGARARLAAHLTCLGGLAALWVLQLLDQVGVTSAPFALGLAAIAAAAAVVAIAKVRIVEDVLAALALAPLVFVGLFLTTSPTAELLGDSSVEAAAVEVTGEPRSIVMVVWDEWPLWSIVGEDGTIDAELYPNLAALAADGAWYRNATTVATATAYAVPAMLTGRSPEPGSVVPLAKAYPENLFTLLAGQYDLEVQESVTRLCPANLCSDDFIDDPDARAEAEAAAADVTSPPSGLDALLADARTAYRSMITPGDDEDAIAVLEDATTALLPPPTTIDPELTQAAVDEAKADVGDEPTFGGMVGMPVLRLETFEAMTGSIEAGEEPTLHFLHVQLPHAPYRFLPGGQAYAEGAGLGPEMMRDVMGVRSAEAAAVDGEKHRLALQVGYVDTMIGQLVERLRSQDLYDDSIVIMTSDHGAGFTPNETIRGLAETEPLREAVYPDLLHVPLIIKAPGIDPGTVRDDNVMSIDVLATIADLLGVALPWEVEGRSLLAAPRTDEEKTFHAVRMGAGGPAGALTAGDEVRWDGSVTFAAMLERHIGTVVRDDNPEHRWYDVHDAGELVGRPLDELEVGDASGHAGTVDPATAEGIVPAHVVGRLTGRGGEGGGTVAVAVVVDGIVAGVTGTYPHEDEPHHLELIVLPELVAEGRDGLQLYEVRGPEGERTLHLISGSG